MALTPEDVSNKRFTPVRLREGYDMGEVDQFLDEVETELGRLVSENAELRSRLGLGDDEPVDAPDAAATAQDGAEGATGETQEEPTSATATGGGQTLRVETVPQASTAAARLLEIATRNADELVDGAKDEADKIIGEARTKAERRESEAKENADQVESDARGRAQLLDSETAERRTQLFADLERDRDRLSEDVEGLRAFEREYRSRLKAYFTEQLAALETGTAAATDEDAEPEEDSGELRSILGDDD